MNRQKLKTLLLVLCAAAGGYWLSQRQVIPFLNSGQLTGFGKDKQNLPVHPEVINLQEAFANVAEAVKPAVVSITATHIEKVTVPQHEFYFGDPFEQFFEEFFNQSPRQRDRMPPRQYQRKFEGMGSGVIIDPEGFILTNDHVVSNADEITIIMSDGKTQYKGRIIGRDPRTDLAVVKIRAPRKLAYAPLGDSSKLRVGDWAIAIGSPFGLQQTLTVGVISALNQSLQIENRAYRDFIQTDAAINRGNSGGPLVNVRGEIIGINTAIFAPTGVFSGVGFAIPVNQAKEILDDLIKKGRVVRGWLGVEMGTDIDETIRKNFSLPDTSGAFVNRVFQDSPAAKAGIQRGDVIREFNGVAVKNRDHLTDLVAKTEPKKIVKVKIIRSGKPLELNLLTSERPSWADQAGEQRPGEAKPEGSAQGKTWKGVSVENFSPDLARELQLDPKESGVVVVALEGDSPLASYLLQGDLIKSVNRQGTPDVQAFGKATKNLKLSQGVLFDIIRQGRALYISVTLPE